MTGIVTNITDYGSFVELEDGIEGLVHVSEMSWTKKNVHPGKIVSTSEKVEVMVLEIDVQKRRISLGIKQCVDNPWEKYKSNNKVGETIEGEIRNITEFGLFIGLSEDIDGLVHLSDLSWDGNGDELIKTYSKGSLIKAKILDIDIDKERLMFALRGYFEKKTIDADWEAINRMNNVELITTLSMICPFSATEQQALLVAEKVEDRASTMISLLEMANHEGDGIEDVKH